MENNSPFPILDATAESAAVLALLLPKLQNLIKEDPAVINELLPLKKNGNKKAKELIKYLTGTIPKYTNYKKITHFGWNSDHTRTYDLSWTDFKFDNSSNLLTFDFEAKFEEEVELHQIEHYFLSATNCYSDRSAFREEFLLKNIEDWLKGKNARIRRRGKMIAHSIKTFSFKYLDGKPNPKDTTKPWRNLTTRAIGKCIIETESL